MNYENKILIRRKNLISIKLRDENFIQTENQRKLLMAMMQNLSSLGYTFSKELFDVLSHMDSEELSDFYFELIPFLQEMVGADVEYEPMYPNFPEQVIRADELELFFNSLVHYYSYGALMPDYEKEEHLPLTDKTQTIVLSIGTHYDLMQIFTNLLSSKTSLSTQDKEDIAEIITNCSDYEKYLPSEIPLKENIALIGKLIIEKSPIKTSAPIEKYFRTATDVLRLVTALSDGDISLATKSKYRNLKRYERRIVLDLLANCGNITEDLFKYRDNWIKVAEIIHPAEYSNKKYKGVNKAFNILRNEKKPLMFDGKVQSAILHKNMKEATDLLTSRPGDFARKLDKLIRDANDADNVDYIIKNFKDIANDISTPVLLQVRQHFLGRMADLPSPVRVFFPKGNIAKLYAVDNKLPNIDKNDCTKVIEICNKALIGKFRKKDVMGNVFIGDELKDCLVPFNQRSASNTSKSIVRGSRFPIKENASIIRSFIWWTNNSENVEDVIDIDLSVSLYDADWKFLKHVSYTNLREMGIYHSGDIINGGSPDEKGVSEFIDIDIDEIAKIGRYAVFQIYSFSSGFNLPLSFKAIKNCRFGWMERECFNSGEIYEPATVNMIMDINSNSTAAIPVIIDCVERKIIWCDICQQKNEFYCNNLERNFTATSISSYSMVNLNKPSLYDLIYLNAFARGTITGDRDNADIIFSNDVTPVYKFNGDNQEQKDLIPIITAFDIDYIIGNLL